MQVHILSAGINLGSYPADSARQNTLLDARLRNMEIQIQGDLRKKLGVRQVVGECFDAGGWQWHNGDMKTSAHQTLRPVASLFNECKAAQAAAFLLHKAGGELALIKLMKLMYLAERLSLKRYGETITGDAFVSMPHGPVLSMTYEHMNGVLPSRRGGWDTWIADRAGHGLSLQDASMIRSPEKDLLALSESDLECLGETWDDYGHFDKWRLRDMTHDGLCPEWEDPHGSSKPIPMKKLLRALGYSDEDAQGLIDKDTEQRYVEAAFRAC